MRWKLAHSRWGSNHDLSITYRVPLLIMSQIIKARHVKYIFIYQGLRTKKLYTKMAKNINWICPMTAILNFTICGKTLSLTAWHTAEMYSAQHFHLETTNEVLFLNNAYRSLSRAIFQCFVLTIIKNETSNEIKTAGSMPKSCNNLLLQVFSIDPSTLNIDRYPSVTQPSRVDSSLIIPAPSQRSTKATMSALSIRTTLICTSGNTIPVNGCCERPCFGEHPFMQNSFILSFTILLGHLEVSEKLWCCK